MSERFDGNFTQQEPLSAEAIDAAVRVMQSGRLHRYNVLPDEIGEVGELELEFAEYVALAIALRWPRVGMPWQRRCGLGDWTWGSCSNKCLYAGPCTAQLPRLGRTQCLWM